MLLKAVCTWIACVAAVTMTMGLVAGGAGEVLVYGNYTCPVAATVLVKEGSVCDADQFLMDRVNTTTKAGMAIRMCQNGLFCTQGTCSKPKLYKDCNPSLDEATQCGSVMHCLTLSHLDAHSAVVTKPLPGRSRYLPPSAKGRPGVRCASPPLVPQSPDDGPPKTQCVIKRYAGERCYHAEECYSGKCVADECNGGGNCGGIVLDDPCDPSKENQCGVDMYCNLKNRCVKRLEANAACNSGPEVSYSNFMSQCLDGLYCSNGVCTEPLTIGQGGSCDVWGNGRPEHRPFSAYWQPSVCMYGLECDPATHTCQPEVKLACDNSSRTECPRFTRCTCEEPSAPQEAPVTPSSTSTDEGNSNGNGNDVLLSRDPMCQPIVSQDCKKEALEFVACTRSSKECMWNHIDFEETCINNFCLGKFQELVCCRMRNGYVNMTHVPYVCPDPIVANKTEKPKETGTWIGHIIGNLPYPSTLGQWIATGLTLFVLVALVGCHLHRTNKCPRWTGLNRTQTMSGKARYGKVINQAGDEEMGTFEVGDDSDASDDELNDTDVSIALRDNRDRRAGAGTGGGHMEVPVEVQAGAPVPVDLPGESEDEFLDEEFSH